MKSKVTPFEIVLYLIGIPLVLFGLYKGKITGYYEDEAPMVFGSLIIGALLCGAAGLIAKARQKAELASRDRAKGIG